MTFCILFLFRAVETPSRLTTGMAKSFSCLVTEIITAAKMILIPTTPTKLTRMLCQTTP